MFYEESEEITNFILHFSHKVLKKIYVCFDDQGGHEKIIKKQENSLLLPFTISLESSSPLSSLKIKPLNFMRKKPELFKINNVNVDIRKSSDIDQYFFKSPDEIVSPTNFTKTMLHQMEHDSYSSKLLLKEETIPEENLPSISTNETENQQLQSNTASGITPKYNEAKMEETMDNEDKEILELFSKDYKNEKPKEEKIDFRQNDHGNFKINDIDDENVPSDVKSFKFTPGVVPNQQRNAFIDLNNSNITYIEEQSFCSNLDTKKNKSFQIFSRKIVREGSLLRKTTNLISGWEVFINKKIHRLKKIECMGFINTRKPSIFFR